MVKFIRRQTSTEILNERGFQTIVHREIASNRSPRSFPESTHWRFLHLTYVRDEAFNGLP